MSRAIDDSVDTYEISPDQEKAFYQKSSAFQGQKAVQKHSKEELLKAHFRNLELLQSSKNATKQLVLLTAYSPSNSTLDTLQKV
jgi:hypothetical protein